MLHRILSTINVDTASGNRDGGGHELSLAGLKDPKTFKEMLWELKRSGVAGAQAMLSAANGGEAPAQQAMGGGLAVEWYLK